MQPNQPVTPLNQPPGNSTVPFEMGPRKSGPSLVTILLIVLGIGALAFAITSIVFYQQAHVATTAINAQRAAAVAKAKTEQKQADDEANLLATESPFRSYVAPEEYGSFEVKFPKNWSGYVDQEQGTTQISLSLNPDFVHRTNGTDELMATRVMLLARPSEQYMNVFTALLKRGTLKQNSITVSDIKGFDLTGTFSDHKTVRQVIIPVRDKVIVFTNEDSHYAKEFSEILAQSKIIP